VSARAWLWVVVAACSHDRGTPAPGSAGGSASASGSTVAAVASDAASPDATPLATQIARECTVRDHAVHCVLTPRDGALRGPRCWRALVAVENHAAATARMLTSRTSCSGDVAPGGTAELDLPFAPKDDPAKPCARDDACEIALVDDADATKETKRWRAQIIERLKSEQADREQEARDREPSDDVDWNKLFKHYVEISVNEAPMGKQHDVEQSIYAAGPMAMGLPDSALKPTKGQVRCAREAASPDGFRDCFAPPPDEPSVPVDAPSD
jgi:hypothetical protein